VFSKDDLVNSRMPSEESLERVDLYEATPHAIPGSWSPRQSVAISSPTSVSLARRSSRSRQASSLAGPCEANISRDRGEQAGGERVQDNLARSQAVA
jgi:hypothetical protein